MSNNEKYKIITYLLDNDRSEIQAYLKIFTLDELFEHLSYLEYRKKWLEFNPLYSRDSKGRFKPNNNGKHKL